MICLSTRSLKMTLSVFVPMLVFSLAQSVRGDDYADAVLADMPTAYYRLGEAAGATTVANSFGDGEDGTVNAGDGGGVTFGHPGAVGGTDGSAHFNGTGWITVLDDNFALDFETGLPFTMEYWMNPDGHKDNDANWHIISRSDPATPAADAFIVNSGTNANFAENVRFHTDGWGGGNHRVDSGANTVIINEWSHVVGTYNGSNEMAIYLNGEQVAFEGNIDVGPQAPPAGDLFIGTLSTVTAGNDYQGYIDEVALYNGTALTPERVLAHYEAGFGPPVPINERAWSVDGHALGFASQSISRKFFSRDHRLRLGNEI